MREDSSARAGRNGQEESVLLHKTTYFRGITVIREDSSDRTGEERGKRNPNYCIKLLLLGE